METPVARLEPNYIMQRMARIKRKIKESIDKPSTIPVDRIDRTITEFS